MNPYSEAVQLNLMQDTPDGVLFLNEGRATGKTHFAKEMLKEGRAFVVTKFLKEYHGMNRVCTPTQFLRGGTRGHDIDFLLFDEVELTPRIFREIQSATMFKQTTVVFLGNIHG